IDTPYGVESHIAFQGFAVLGKQLFAGTDYGVFVSTDQGMSWQPINRGLPSPIQSDVRKYVKTLAVSGDTLFAGTAGSGIFRFDNQSRNWTEINNGLLNRDVNTFAVSGDRIIVGTEAGISVSTDRGENWRSANAGIQAHVIDYIDVIDNRLLVGTGGNVYA